MPNTVVINKAKLRRMVIEGSIDQKKLIPHQSTQTTKIGLKTAIRTIFGRYRKDTNITKAYAGNHRFRANEESLSMS